MNPAKSKQCRLVNHILCPNTLTIIALAISTLLFIAVNIAYLCVVPKETIIRNSGVDIATLFFSRLFATEVAERVMAAVIAVSIFGNLIVMTFTASRVKQEIAKQGILGPPSLFFATGHTTPWAWIRRRFSTSTSNPQHSTIEYMDGVSPDHGDRWQNGG